MTTVASVLLAITLMADAPYVRSRVNTTAANPHCLWWKQGEVVVRQESTGNPATTSDNEFTAISRSLQAWNDALASCAGLHFTEGPRTSERKIGLDSQNGVVFRTASCVDKVSSTDSCWEEETCSSVYDCWAYSRETIGLTTTTYDRSTGRIYDADVEMNAVDYTFTTVDGPPCIKPFWRQDCVATDVQNTMTHEAGHMLGLAHTNLEGALMNTSAPPGETSKRVIDPGSREGVCQVYPRGGASRDCVINPVKANLGAAAAAGCSAAPGTPLFATALACLSLRRRRRA